MRGSPGAVPARRCSLLRRTPTRTNADLYIQGGGLRAGGDSSRVFAPRKSIRKIGARVFTTQFISTRRFRLAFHPTSALRRCQLYADDQMHSCVNSPNSRPTSASSLDALPIVARGYKQP